MNKLSLSKNIQLSAAPNGRQNQIGLVEQNWYSCVRMSRPWLFANIPPAKFWFYALKRATDLSNYFPILNGDKVTTLFELVHNTESNFWPIFPINLVPKQLKQLQLENQTIQMVLYSTIQLLTI